jgi:hypothetical protein
MIASLVLDVSEWPKGKRESSNVLVVLLYGFESRYLMAMRASKSVRLSSRLGTTWQATLHFMFWWECETRIAGWYFIGGVGLTLDLEERNSLQDER